MLSWWSGDPHATSASDSEPPETPAHTFVTRAFKQAIFGTPAPPLSQRTSRTRTQSMDEHRPRQLSKTRHAATAVGRPTEPRLRSNSFDSSPAKPPGILLTPGTSSSRRKSVTWDARDAKKVGVDRDGKPHHEHKSNHHRGLQPNDFTNRLRGTYQPPRDAAVDQQTTQPEADTTADMSQPRSSSGRYWKDKFETLEKTSTHDIRKLKKKEEVAKKFGQSRDDEAVQLEEDLKKEQGRVSELQLQVEDFRTRMKSAVDETSERNRKTEAPRRRTKEEIARAGRQGAQDASEVAELEDLRSKNTALEQALTEQRKVSSTHLRSKETEIAELHKKLQDSEGSRHKAEAELAEQRRISSTHLRAKERELARLQREFDSLKASAARTHSPPARRTAATPADSTASTAPAAPATRASSTPRPSATAPADNMPSDIWAEAGSPEKIAVPARSPRRRAASGALSKANEISSPDRPTDKGSPSRRTRRTDASGARDGTRGDRAPLSHRASATLNASTDSSSADAEAPRSKAMTDERREAARRRVEERRQRARDGQGGGAGERSLNWE